MEKIKMPAKKRELTGKKAKNLRREKWILGNIYGRDVDSLSVMVEEPVFKQTFHKAGETGLIEVAIEGEAPRSVLVKDVQKDVVSGAILHVDFYQVNLKEKITTIVPLTFIGEPEMIKQGEAILLTIISELEVECLPADIPSELTVEIGNLADFEQVIAVKDIPVPADIEVKTDPDEVVCKLDTAEIKEEEEPTPATEEGMAGAEQGEAGASEEGGESSGENGEKKDDKSE